MFHVVGPTAVLLFVGWLFLKRYRSKKLQNVWIELLTYSTLMYMVFTVAMTINSTYEQAGYDLVSYEADYENCRDPRYSDAKAKAGSDMCKVAKTHHGMSTWQLTNKRLHDMGILKIVSGYSLVEMFVNLTESSYWTFAILVMTFVVIMSTLVFLVKWWNKPPPLPAFNLSGFEVEHKEVPSPSGGPSTTITQVCQNLGKGVKTCLPVSIPGKKFD
jgi:hypothetical protein